MRITKIAVKGLFGYLDHEIPLNQDSRITIIHGPNGIGKTVLLRMIDGLFKSKFGVFTEIPFNVLRVDLSNGTSLSVEQQRPGRQMPIPKLHEDAGNLGWSSPSSAFSISHSQNQGTDTESYFPTFSHDKGRRFFEIVESIPELDRIGGNRWVNEITGSVLTRTDVIDSYDLESLIYGGEEPGWFTTIRHGLHTRFIKAQRLHNPTNSIAHRNYYSSRETSVTPSAMVERYSQEIARTIRNTLTQYGQESQQIDRSFPTRLMESSETHQMVDQTALQKKLNCLETKSSELMELGLFEHKDAPDIPKLDRKQENLTNVLSIYVQDIEEKLSVFDTIFIQLRTLTSIINERFQHKRLKIDKQEGFVILARNDQRIPISSLSSGEQHELVLFYQLLFNIQPNSLILIDEPEISLHVNWQELFLDDILRTSELGNFDVLIATHSPDIIGDKHDWMVGLGEREFA